MVGRVGVEPTTSRLSGMRSNHLSYRPPQSPAGHRAAGGVSQLRLHFLCCCRDRTAAFAATIPWREAFPVMKGHEDGGNVLWKERSIPRRKPKSGRGAFFPILRKEVIQPQVPLRLPCYDFTPVADPTVVACLPCGLAQRLRVKPTPMV